MKLTDNEIRDNNRYSQAGKAFLDNFSDREVERLFVETEINEVTELNKRLAE